MDKSPNSESILELVKNYVDNHAEPDLDPNLIEESRRRSIYPAASTFYECWGLRTNLTEKQWLQSIVLIGMIREIRLWYVLPINGVSFRLSYFERRSVPPSKHDPENCCDLIDAMI